MIDLNFKIETEQFKLTIAKHNEKSFMVRTANEEKTILCPQDTDFRSIHIQTWLKKVIEEMLRKKAQQIFPKRLRKIATLHKFEYKKVTIKNMHTRWGSCSSLGNINLSIYLLLVPRHLADYVMLHELCHTREMNHGENFWKLLNECTEGKAIELREELKPYIPYIDCIPARL